MSIPFDDNFKFTNAVNPANGLRSLLARQADTFNVKDFGAKGDGSTDDGPAVQAAAAAAATGGLHGGIIFFPPGIYQIDTRIVLPTASSLLVFRGCGSDVASLTGSVLRTNRQDYILSPPHKTITENCLIAGMSDLGFINSYNATDLTSVEPPWMGLTGVGQGCVNAALGAAVYENCEFKVDKGVGLVSAGSPVLVKDCKFYGTFSGGSTGTTTSTSSIGLFLPSGIVHNCAFYNLAYALTSVWGAGGAYIAINGIEITNCGRGFYPGWAPVTTFSIVDSLPIEYAAGSGGGCSVEAHNVFVRGCSDTNFGGMTGLADSPNWSGDVSNIYVDGTSAIGGGVANVGFLLNAGIGRNVTIIGNFSVAAVDNQNQNQTIFEAIRASNSSGTGKLILLPTAFNPSPDPNQTIQLGGASIYRSCNFEDARAIATLPGIGLTTDDMFTVTDSLDPAWTGSVSNVGKPVGVILTTTSSTTTASTVLHFASVPGSVVASGFNPPATIVEPLTNRLALPDRTFVTNVSGGNVTLNVAPNATVNAGDKFQFLVGGGANTLKVKWNGDFWAITAR